jgi:hypothetical protein
MPKLFTYENELKMVRQELRDLKRCQVQYFILSISATAAILGFGKDVANDIWGGLTPLAALIVLLPCWWIFFDKATTITRNVGYACIIESLIDSHPQPVHCHIGFENALLQYRQEDNDRPNWPDQRWPAGFFKTMSFRVRHRYWIVNWYTFAVLSFLCCITAAVHVRSPLEILIVLIAASLVIISAIATIQIIGLITIGKYSYKANKEFWQSIL